MYRLTEIIFLMRIYMKEQNLQLVSAGSLYERSFLQTTGYGNDQVHKKCSYDELIF